MKSLNLVKKISFLLCLLFIGVSHADSIQLFDKSDNRAKVIQAAYSYYPGKAELRVHLTLENRQVKTGVYRDDQVINHLLTILSKKHEELYCSYEGNKLIAIGEFSNIH